MNFCDHVPPPSVLSNSPPEVAAQTTEVDVGSTAIALTVNGADPREAPVHDAPPLLVLKTCPFWLPTYATEGFAGSIAIALGVVDASTVDHVLPLSVLLTTSALNAA